MSKNIVIFSDGTGQDGGVRPEQRMSNVYKMYRACRVGPESGIDPTVQVAFYDPGLGTDAGASAMTAPVRFVQKLLASVTGRGITTNIVDCYEFIINHFEEGDRIYLVGFSRGAYTVRCIANLLMLCGVPTSVDGKPIPRFRKAAHDIAEEAVSEVFEYGAGHPRGKHEAGRFEKARCFRARYGSNSTDMADKSNAAPHFVGVFDTVAALGAKGIVRYGIAAGLLCGGLVLTAGAAAILGLILHVAFWNTFATVAVAAAIYGLWKWLRPAYKSIRDFPKAGDHNWHMAMWKAGNYDRLLSGHVGYARSANAIDETRADFDRVGWGSAGGVRPREPNEPQPLIQMWFAGNHSDIGGSYPETESRLSDIALDWMVAEARSIPHPLVIEEDRLHRHPSANGIQHCEIAGMHDTIERRTWRLLRPLAGRFNWAVKIRDIKAAAPVHPTVKERFDLPSVLQCAGSGPYRPEALAGHDEFKGR